MPVCSACLAGVRLCAFEPACPRCGRLAANGSVCARCQIDPPAFDSIASWAWYEGAGRELIRLLKFHGVLPAADFLATQMIHHLPVPPSADLAIAVPLARRRRRQRGFNQAERMARCWARHHRLPTRFRALWRSRETAPQWGLSAHERHANVAGAFAADFAAVSGRHIVLFDDVVTTGATVSACAEALRHAGASGVHVLTAARAPWHDAAGGPARTAGSAAA